MGAPVVAKRLNWWRGCVFKGAANSREATIYTRSHIIVDWRSLLSSGESAFCTWGLPSSEVVANCVQIFWDEVDVFLSLSLSSLPPSLNLPCNLSVCRHAQKLCYPFTSTHALVTLDNKIVLMIPDRIIVV